MKGDDRVRFCEECNLHVYNFSAMTPVEINRLVAQREGRLCARLYQRVDGTTLTKNCPVGFRAAFLRASGFATVTLSTLLSFAPAAVARSPQKRETPVQLQAISGAVFLEVTDVTGAVIPNAKVTIRNESTGKELTFKTDDTGRVQIADLPKGQYEIVIVSPGFATKTLTHVSAPSPELHKVQLELAQMGGVVFVGELAPEHKSPVKKFFSKIRHII